jgi:hypothetical protein
MLAFQFIPETIPVEDPESLQCKKRSWAKATFQQSSSGLACVRYWVQFPVTPTQRKAKPLLDCIKNEQNWRTIYVLMEMSQ